MTKQNVVFGKSEMFRLGKNTSLTLLPLFLKTVITDLFLLKNEFWGKHYL